MLFASAQDHPITAILLKLSKMIRTYSRRPITQIVAKNDCVHCVRTLNRYSFLIDFTGFARAVLIVLYPTVTIDTSRAATPATKNVIQWSSIWYANSLSHWFIKKYASGQAITFAITMTKKNCFKIKLTILTTDAPRIFRTPISFVRYNIRYPRDGAGMGKFAVDRGICLQWTFL